MYPNAGVGRGGSEEQAPDRGLGPPGSGDRPEHERLVELGRPPADGAAMQIVIGPFGLMPYGGFDRREAVQVHPHLPAPLLHLSDSYR